MTTETVRNAQRIQHLIDTWIVCRSRAPLAVWLALHGE
jgi:hypothetical protein